MWHSSRVQYSSALKLIIRAWIRCEQLCVRVLEGFLHLAKFKFLSLQCWLLSRLEYTFSRFSKGLVQAPACNGGIFSATVHFYSHIAPVRWCLFQMNLTHAIFVQNLHGLINCKQPHHKFWTHYCFLIILAPGIRFVCRFWCKFGSLPWCKPLLLFFLLPIV